MPESIAVLGGGLAGISAAVRLTKLENISISLYESSPKLGGRVNSFYDEEFGCELDNGQHLLLGCYKETLQLLNLLGATQLLAIDNKLHLPYLLPSGKFSFLTSSSAPYPFSLLSALLNFDIIPATSRLKQVLFAVKMLLTSEEKLRGKSVAEWFNNAGFNADEREVLWEVISTGALNTSPAEADAALLMRLLKIVFFRGSSNYRFMVPAAPLHSLFSKSAEKYFNENNVHFSAGTRIERIAHIENKFHLYDNKNQRYTADKIIAAIPPFALQKIETGRWITLPELDVFEYSPIVSVHLKCNPEKFPHKYFTLFKSPVQWVFKQPYGASLVISAAQELVNAGNDEIGKMCVDELVQRKLLNREDISAVRVVKEKRATIKCTPFIERHRPGVRTSNKDFFLAGDWTDTGYPSTIEGAVLSGSLAAAALKQRVKN